MSLLDKMLKAGSVKGSSILSKSSFFNVKDPIQTELPIVNIAFCGSLKGGLLPGLTIVAGESKSFKTLLGLYCMKAYLQKYPEGIAILYDSEYGITPEYLESYSIDTDRVIHVPIEDVEQLKFDATKRLDEIDKGDKVFIMIDSIGNLASRKEVQDALDERSVADMTRAIPIKKLVCSPRTSFQVVLVFTIQPIRSLLYLNLSRKKVLTLKGLSSQLILRSLGTLKKKLNYHLQYCMIQVFRNIQVYLN